MPFAISLRKFDDEINISRGYHLPFPKNGQISLRKLDSEINISGGYLLPLSQTLTSFTSDSEVKLGTFSQVMILKQIVQIVEFINKAKEKILNICSMSMLFFIVLNF